jgi:hypothetical protein
MEIKLTHGKRGNEILTIEEVESGLACDCTCPACGSVLVAKKGEIKAKHFAHYSKQECEYQAETELHYLAKQILERSKRIVLPEYYLENGVDIRIRDKEFVFDSVVSERKLGSIVPDIVLFKGDRLLLVEIAVTHFVDEIKQRKIDELKIPVIEIDLGYIDRSTNKQVLSELVLNQTFNMEWKYNEKVDEVHQRAKEERERRDFIASEKRRKLEKELAEKEEKIEQKRAEREPYYLTRLRDVVKREPKNALYGVIYQVPNCPLKKRDFFGEFYANVNADCFSCDYYRGLRENNTKIICLKKGNWLASGDPILWDTAR